jgi:hypothetical protein
MTATIDTRFGRTLEQWQRAVDAGVMILKGVARDRNVITYSAFCYRVYDYTGIEFDPGEFALPHLLGDIFDAGRADGGICLTALVVFQGKADSGHGFYSLAVKRGLISKDATEQDKLRFHTDQVHAAYRRYGRPQHPPGWVYQHEKAV